MSSHIKERKTYQSYSEYLKKSIDPGRPACRRLKTPYTPAELCCVPGSNQILGDNIFIKLFYFQIYLNFIGIERFQK